MIRAILIVQLVTYMALGVMFLRTGDYRFAGAQFLLTGVQTLLFWEALTA